MSKIHDSLSNEGGIRRAVEVFCDGVAADPALAPYFVGTDMDRLHWHQTALLCAVTGGPQRFDGRDLASAHAGLGITEEHFTRVIAHLVVALRSFRVPERTVDEVAHTFSLHRPHIVATAAPERA